MKRSMRIGLLLVLTLTCSAFGHKLNLWAQVEDGRTISGHAYFAGGARAKGIAIEVRGPDGSLLGETHTDDQGSFTFEATAHCDHRLVADAGDGHRGEFMIRADDLPQFDVAAETATVSSTSTDAALDDVELANLVDNAVARHVAPLRRQIESYEQRTRLRDVIGGIGYILGVAGLGVFLLGRRSANK